MNKGKKDQLESSDNYRLWRNLGNEIGKMPILSSEETKKLAMKKDEGLLQRRRLVECSLETIVSEIEKHGYEKDFEKLMVACASIQAVEQIVSEYSIQNGYFFDVVKQSVFRKIHEMEQRFPDKKEFSAIIRQSLNGKKGFEKGVWDHNLLQMEIIQILKWAKEKRMTDLTGKEIAVLLVMNSRDISKVVFTEKTEDSCKNGIYHEVWMRYRQWICGLPKMYQEDVEYAYSCIQEGEKANKRLCDSNLRWLYKCLESKFRSYIAEDSSDSQSDSRSDIAINKYDIFVDLYEKLPRIIDMYNYSLGSTTTYLKKFVSSECASNRKKSSEDVLSNAKYEGDEENSWTFNNIADRSQLTPEASAMNRMAEQAAVGEMNDVEYAVYSMYELEKLRIDNIAEKLGMTKHRVLDIIKKNRKLIEMYKENGWIHCRKRMKSTRKG